MKTLKNLSTLAALVLAAGGALAGQNTAPGATPATVQQTAADSAAPALTRGTVKKIDVEQGKITIQHEAIDNLGMPGMTMVFRAAQPGLLEQARVGQAVGFRAERVDGAFVVTRLQAR